MEQKTREQRALRSLDPPPVYICGSYEEEGVRLWFSWCPYGADPYLLGPFRLLEYPSTIGRYWRLFAEEIRDDSWDIYWVFSATQERVYIARSTQEYAVSAEVERTQRVMAQP